jgi:hypothetical protein
MTANIPRPGPANLGPNAGLDEWLEEAKQCHYLPERAMKELCEKVKEILMEGTELIICNSTFVIPSLDASKKKSMEPLT